VNYHPFVVSFFILIKIGLLRKYVKRLEENDFLESVGLQFDSISRVLDFFDVR